MVLVGMAQQLGAHLQAVAPSLWQHIAGPLLEACSAEDAAPTAEPPSGDAQVEWHLAWQTQSRVRDMKSCSPP